MMTLYDRIMAIHPTLVTQDFLTVIRLQNDSDGRGDYIAAWNHPTFAQPTQEQLDAVGGI
jgi:hypothetical protein